MNGKRPVAPEGMDQTARQLVVREAPSGRGIRHPMVLGLAWCLIGSVGVVMVPVISCAVIAYGLAVAARGAGRRGELVALLASLVASVLGTSLMVSPYDIPSAVLSVICSYAMVRGVVRGRLRTAGMLLAGVAVTVALVGIDMVSTSLQGTTIDQVIREQVNLVVESSSGSLDLDGTAALIEAKEQVMAYWPTIYFVTAMGMVLCSLLGAISGMRAAGAPVARGLIARYDVPLWVAELFALGVAAELLGPRLPSWADEVTMAGLNVVMCTRLALAQQGLSVLHWWLREHRVNPFKGSLLILLGVWLELSFALTSVVGLLDVIANFRHIERRRGDLALWPTRER